VLPTNVNLVCGYLLYHLHLVLDNFD